MFVDKDNLWQGVIIATLAPVAGYAGTLLKDWIEQGGVRARRTNLCDDAARLIKFHATLAEAAVPSQRMQIAQASIVSELDRVLEELSRSLTNPQESGWHVRSGAIVTIENWLLLYRPYGFFSWVLHSLFSMMVALWFFVFYIGFIGDLKRHTHDVGVGIAVMLIFLVPIVAVNYLARKIDARARQRQQTADLRV